jgi:hypothetical protein
MKRTRHLNLDDAAVVLGDFRIDELMAQRFEAFEGAFLVRPHQPRIPGDIGDEDRGKTAGLARTASPAASRRPDRNRSRCSGFEYGTEPDESALGAIVRSRSMTARASSSRPICP